MDKAKPFDIPKLLVWRAYHLVKANKGSAGVDQESLSDFEKNMSKNLYKLWNRLCSGSYFPPAVKGVEIPKKQGGTRLLGVPTVGDRICQMVVKLAFEPKVEPIFHDNSYGYRPGKSALDAVGVTRTRCWKYDWVLEFDIRGLFDNIDHTLLMKAVKTHTDNKWVLLYIERWLKASIQMPNEQIVDRNCGTPQGGVISPTLSNLFLHYVFDMWMVRNHANKPWARYADDGLVHCRSEVEAQALLVELKLRFNECKLELHPDKTKVVYCGRNNTDYPISKFTFLGYEFRKRTCKSKTGILFTGFTPAVSNSAIKSMIDKIKASRIKTRAELSIEQIAHMFNPVLNGWINYYGKYTRSSLYKVLRYFNCTIVNWLARKHKFYKRNKYKAINLLIKIAKFRPHLFVHWKLGMEGAFV